MAGDTRVVLITNYIVTESTCTKGKIQVCTATFEQLLSLTIKRPTMQGMREMFNAVDENGHFEFPNSSVLFDGSHIPIWMINRPIIVASSQNCKKNSRG